MTQALKTAIDEVTAVIESKLREVAELKRTVNALCQQAGLERQYETTDIEEQGRRVVLHRDTYYGRPLATAIREHLEAQHHALPMQEILTALEQGGFDFDSIEWGSENRLRNLAISVSKNPFLKRLPSGVVGLRSWYDDSAKESGGQKGTGKKKSVRRKTVKKAAKAKLPNEKSATTKAKEPKAAKAAVVAAKPKQSSSKTETASE